MEPADSQEDEGVAAEVKTVLELLEPFPAMISAMLEDDVPVGVRSYHDRKRLAAFILMEVTDALESLKLMPLPLRDDQIAVQHTKDWLEKLTVGIRFIRTFLKLADNRCYTLMQRAKELLVKSKMPTGFLIHWMIGRDPYRWRHLLPATSSPGLPPLEAKEGGPPPVGIDRTTKKLLTWLMPCDEDRSRRVISIVGPAGMGKTTLARELRKQLACQTSGHFCFHYCIMVQTSRTINRNEILLQDILSKVSDKDDQSRYTTFELLVPRVFECLQDKRYFIIIEDMWDASDWEVIKGAFPESHNDSRILVTSRVRSVAWSCCNASLVHEMKALKDLDSQNLLLARAFGSADHCPADNIKTLCDEILFRCEGIPLFLIGMADWLREDQEKELVPQLSNRFDQALYPAYDDLPYELKLLCLNMSMLPPGYVFDKDCLMKKWVYEELVYDYDVFPTAPSENTERWFSSLIDRNIITRSCRAPNSQLNPDDVDVSQWKVNPVMMQFFISKSAEKGFAYTSDMLNLAAASTPDYGKSTVKPRRVALHHPIPLLPFVLEKIDFSQTCSLSVSGAVEILPFKVFVNLSSLDVEGWDNFNDDYLLEICKSEMIFLNCLTIKRTRVSRLPPEIKNLASLVMLDISFTQISELPLEVFKLEKLIDLDVQGTRISHFPKEDWGSWPRFRVLRASRATRMPFNAYYFSSLSIVATIDLKEYHVSVLEALANLKKLKMISMELSSHQCTRGAFSNTLMSCIQGWSELKSLTIHCEMGCSMEFLGSLSVPPKLLEVFKVTAARFPTLPQWINRLERLHFVQITVCRLGLGELDILGGLPRLECLVLSLDLIPGSAIVVENVGFPELVRFSFECLVPCITFKTGAMRKLTYVQFKLCTCPVIQTSTLSSIGNLQSLTEVELFYSIWEMFSPNINITVDTMRKAIVKHHNQISLSINGVEDLDVLAADEDKGSADGTQSSVDAESAVVVVPTVDEKAGRAIVEFESEIVEEEIQHCS